MCHTKYSVKAIKPKNRNNKVYHITLQWKVEVMRELNETALVLLEFYYTKIGQEFNMLNDSGIAETLGWKVTKVRDTRQRLTKHGYFSSSRYRNSDGDVLYSFKLGKDEWLNESAKDTQSRVKYGNDVAIVSNDVAVSNSDKMKRNLSRSGR